MAKGMSGLEPKTTWIEISGSWISGIEIIGKWFVSVIARVLALALLQNQLLDVLVCENTPVLKQKVLRLRLVVVTPVFLMFQWLLWRHLVVNHLPLFSLLRLRRSYPLADATPHEWSLRLTRTTHHIVFLTFASHLRGVFVLAVVLSTLVLGFGLKVVVVSWEVLSKWLCEH